LLARYHFKNYHYPWEEAGDSERTKAGGLFDLPLPDACRPGERIGLQVHKRERVEIRLLPLGSKKWWSDDRTEKFIADTADRAKEQIAGEKERRTPDFGRYIKEWAIQYGFSADQAKAEIDCRVAETRRKQDNFYRLGLAASAEKNFGKAHRLFLDSAGSNEKRRREAERRFGEYREATVRDYRLTGDAAYNDYLIRAPISTENNGFFIGRRYAIPRVFDRCFRCAHRRQRRRFLGSLYLWHSRPKLCLCYERKRTTTPPPPAQESFCNYWEVVRLFF